MNGIENWSAVYQSMKESKTAIFALQETHLDDNMLLSIDQCFGKRLSIINSKLPGNPRTLVGVTFIINRSLIAPRDLEVAALIEWCVLAIKFKWHGNDDILLINVYAPNNKSTHPAFWERIDETRWLKGLQQPDMLLGDFNVTEDQIGRATAHLDDIAAIAALRNLRQCLGLEDTWCHAFPHDRSCTYRATLNGQAIKSRLDQIYMSKESAKVALDWKTTQTAVLTNHWMVSVRYAPSQAPFIGTGRWTMQIPELKKKELINRIVDRGKTLQAKLCDLSRAQIPCDVKNTQSLWVAFKADIVKLTKKHCSKTQGKLGNKILDIEKDLKCLAGNPELDTNDIVRTEEAFLVNELTILKRIQARDRKDKCRTCSGNTPRYN